MANTSAYEAFVTICSCFFFRSLSLLGLRNPGSEFRNPIADCGHKAGLNGVDNGRIWFDKVRIPRENVLNAVADVTPDGQYVSSIENPDQRFGVLMAPLSSSRVAIAVSAINQAKLGLATALRYALARRAFSYFADQPEVLLLDYLSRQHRLLPLLAKTYAMNFAALSLKKSERLQGPSCNI